MLRILGGDARGRPLKAGPKSPHLRPILARVKKSVFDILTPRLPQSRFLDLFAGSGAVGIEALSRGARLACFVENDRRSLKYLKENLSTLNLTEKSRIYPLSASGPLDALTETFEIVFLGPPYKDEAKTPLALVVPTVQQIQKAGLVANGGLVVAQHHKKEPVGDTGLAYAIVRRERYGDTMVTFFGPR